MSELLQLQGHDLVTASDGQSTLARRYADEHPLTLALEIDGLRGMIGSWLSEPERSGRAARRIAIAAARTHLTAGHDVVVPQLLTRREFVHELESLAESVGATFHEVTLLDSKELVLARLEQR